MESKCILSDQNGNFFWWLALRNNLKKGGSLTIIGYKPAALKIDILEKVGNDSLVLLGEISKGTPAN